jgi:hypothetical protein
LCRLARILTPSPFCPMSLRTFTDNSWVLPWQIQVDRPSRPVFSVMIVSIILSRKVHMYMCPIPSGFRHRAISLYSSEIVNMKEILRTVSNAGIYCSSDEVGTVYLVQYSYIFANCTANINALCNSCEDMACCSTVPRKPFGIGHMYTFTSLLRITDTMTSQNIDLSSWNTLYRTDRLID